MNELKKTVIVKKYKLVTPLDAKKFVWITSRFKGEVDCIETNRNVSAKSILGVLSLDLFHPIIVQFHDAYGNEEMFNELKEWEVE